MKNPRVVIPCLTLIIVGFLCCIWPVFANSGGSSRVTIVGGLDTALPQTYGLASGSDPNESLTTGFTLLTTGAAATNVHIALAPGQDALMSFNGSTFPFRVPANTQIVMPVSIPATTTLKVKNIYPDANFNHGVLTVNVW